MKKGTGSKGNAEGGEKKKKKTLNGLKGTTGARVLVLTPGEVQNRSHLRCSDVTYEDGSSWDRLTA